MSCWAARPLGGGVDDGRCLAQIASPLQRGDDEGLTAVGLLAAVEEAHGLDDPARAWWLQVMGFS